MWIFCNYSSSCFPTHAVRQFQIHAGEVLLISFALVLRVWDVLLFEGSRIMIFRTALALMDLYGNPLFHSFFCVTLNFIFVFRLIVGLS